MIRFSVIFIINLHILLSINYCRCEEFNYGDEGPDVWPILYVQCAGHKQSPIDVHLCQAKYDQSLQPVEFINYGLVTSWNVSHNGHTVIFTPATNETKPLVITDSNFQQAYRALQFHFHWGENDYQGSEHQVEDVKFPLEMHIVHVSRLNSTAVLAFLFHLSENDNPALNTMLQAIDTSHDESIYKIFSFAVSNILPPENELIEYFRYYGSLTTPPCTEGVIWTLFNKTIPISSKQLRNFHQDRLNKNFRYPQNLYSRELFISVKYKLNEIIMDGCKESDNNTYSNGLVRLNASKITLFHLVFTYLIITLCRV